MKVKYKKIKVCIMGPVLLQDLLSDRKQNNFNKSLGAPGAPWLANISRSISKSKNLDVSVVSLSNKAIKSIKVKKINKIKAYFCPQRAHHIRFNGWAVGKIFDFFNKEINYILKAIDIIKPDIILAFWPYEYAYAAHKSKIKYILVNQDVPHKVFYYIPTLYRFVRFIMAKYILKKVRNIITPSMYLKKETQKYSNRNIKVIYNPTDESFFLKKNTIKKSNKIKKILMINNGFNERKNVKKAIIAFTYLIKNKLSHKLYLYGNEMGINEACYNWAIKEKIDLKNIYFMGYIDNSKLANIFKKSDIFLSTSLEETFGVTYSEAMAAGLPIIAGNKSGASKEVIKNCGILTDVLSAKSICKSIMKYNNEKIYNKKRIMGIKRANRYLNLNIITKNYIDHIKYIYDHK
ncbi:glycosyltransferase [Candidatus Pelagibacter sp.]|nr:glycosyltransferase [Candidatus Pelagibacter sp.]